MICMQNRRLLIVTLRQIMISSTWMWWGQQQFAIHDRSLFEWIKLVEAFDDRLLSDNIIRFFFIPKPVKWFFFSKLEVYIWWTFHDHFQPQPQKFLHLIRSKNWCENIQSVIIYFILIWSNDSLGIENLKLFFLLEFHNFSKSFEFFIFVVFDNIQVQTI